MRQIFKLIIIGLIAFLIAFPILAYMGVNSPLPFNTWGTQIYTSLTTLSFSKVSASFWALIGSVGGLAGLSGGLAYIYKKTKKSLQQTQTALSNTQQQAATLTTKTNSLTQANSELQAKSDASLKQLSAEKEAALTQAKTYQGQVETQAEALKRAAIAQQEKTAQNIADFTQKLPGNSVVMDPTTGNMIKTIEKIVVK